MSPPQRCEDDKDDRHFSFRTCAERSLLLQLPPPRRRTLLQLEDLLLQDPIYHVHSSVHIRSGGGNGDGNGSDNGGGNGSDNVRDMPTHLIRMHLLEDHYLWCDLFTYKRFLCARRWDVDDAWQYMQRWMQWRTETKPHTIHSATVEKEIRMEQAYWLEHFNFRGGKDRLQDNDNDNNGGGGGISGGDDDSGGGGNEGDSKRTSMYPVIVVNLHNHIVSERSIEGCLRYTMFMAEQGVSLMMHAADERVDRYCILYDASRFSMRRNMDLPMVREFINIASMYPETLQSIFVCRPSFVFRHALNLMRALLDKDTAQKIIIIHDMAELREYYDEDMLPEEFGGSAQIGFDAEALIAAGRADRKTEMGLDTQEHKLQAA